MGDAVLILAVGAVAAASVYGAYQGWRAIVKNPRLLGSPLGQRLREARQTKGGTIWLVFLAVCAVAGLIGGVLLADAVHKGKEQHEERRGR